MTVATALLVVAGVTIPGLISGAAGATRIGLLGTQAGALAPQMKRTASAAESYR